MSESVAAGAPAGVPMGSWRVTYTPGDWMVFAGPKALVVMPPAPAHVSQLLNDLWDDVSQAGSIDHLLHTLSAYGADGMPYLAAFFWDHDGMHSLVRGPIAVIDLTTGDVVNHGEGVRSWREVGLGELAQVRIDFQEVDQSTLVQLPLVTGAVTASAIVLDSQGFVPAFAADAMPDMVAMPADNGDELMPEVESAGGQAVVAEAAQPGDFPEPPTNSRVADLSNEQAALPDEQPGPLTEQVWVGDESADEQLVDPRDDPSFTAESIAGGMAEPSPDPSVEVQPETVDFSAAKPVTDAPQPGVDGIDVSDEVTVAEQPAAPAPASPAGGVPWGTQPEAIDTSGAPQLDANPYAHAAPEQPAVHSAFADLQAGDEAAWPSDEAEVPAAPPAADWSHDAGKPDSWAEPPSPAPDSFPQLATDADGTAPSFHDEQPFGQASSSDTLGQPAGAYEQHSYRPTEQAFGQQGYAQQGYGQPNQQFSQPSFAQQRGAGRPGQFDQRMPAGQPGQFAQPGPFGQGQLSQAGHYSQGQFDQGQFGQAGPFGQASQQPPYGQPGQFGDQQAYGQPGQFPTPSSQPQQPPVAPMPQPWQQDDPAGGWQPPAAPQEGAASGFADDSHDGATIFSSSIAYKPASSSHDDARLAVFCPAGHPNPPGSHRCRVCRDSVDPRQSRPIETLVLATVEVSTGEAVALTGPVLIGRAPNAGGQDPQAKLITVPSPSHDISRTHVSITPRDWNIEVADLHSTNGTVVIPPGESPIELESGERVSVELGTVIDLGDGVTITLGDPR